jgi:shikimate dehydrogenase
MPGCGKSTIAPLLAEVFGKTVVDTDAEIERMAGISIPTIFQNEGEPVFREREAAVAAEVGKQSGLVIATGGGCVTRDENYHSLHQNGTIFCLNRDLQILPTDGRPLSKTGKLEEMYRIRKPLYDRFADYQIDNNGDAYDAVRQIQNILEDNP